MRRAFLRVFGRPPQDVRRSAHKVLTEPTSQAVEERTHSAARER
jgi:hypothetical protein